MLLEKSNAYFSWEGRRPAQISEMWKHSLNGLFSKYIYYWVHINISGVYSKFVIMTFMKVPFW